MAKTGELLKAKDIIILDGGLGTELEFRGYDLSQDPLWSAGLVQRDPGALAAIHRSYLEAGADVITAATYQGSIGPMTEQLFAELVRIAVSTRDKFVQDHQAEIEFVGAPKRLGESLDSPTGDDVNDNINAPRRQQRKWPLVAVGMGPYGAYLGKGQEYTGDYGEVSKSTLIEFHRRKLEALAAEGIEPELLLFETIPNSLELAAIADLLQQQNQKQKQPTKVWLALSVRFDKNATPNGHNQVFLADGTSLTSAESSAASNSNSSLEPQFRALAPYISAIGVNCCPLDKVELALTELGAIFSQSSMSALSPTPPLLIAYPNSGEVYSGETKTWSLPTTQNNSKEGLGTGNAATCPNSATCNTNEANAEEDCGWDLAGNSQAWIRKGARIIGGCCRTRPADIAKLRKTIGDRLD